MPSNATRQKLFAGFTKDELKVFAKLNTPQKIQDFLNSLPMNYAPETLYSPKLVLKHRKAHCAEGALFAAAVLWYHGQKPLLMDLQTVPKDYDHVVALFKQFGHFGAISKTNHAVLRYREPVYKTPRELAMSFFHEYFKNTGEKTMRAFSLPYDLSKIKDKSWLTTDKPLWDLIFDLDQSAHKKIASPAQIKNMRKADKVEIRAGKLVQFNKKNS